ncbi:ATP-binding protein [Microcoleus sp. bin38.metabat.b11b12b14.051]|uniref:ATP-binding protein n=1 Tax=Microcoleus sp. bin38.metabat.b11b12b14.051 TaxID=2742709 RepID=UPI0025FE4D73|nr:ATP-binding protein [Microcoleus sp. bin38.metabat.b11b12b14.051]
MAGLLRASEEGLKIIDMVRRNLEWNKTEDSWCLAALVSTATLKRFWARKGIRRENFINICNAVEINNWEYIAEGYKIQKTEPLFAASIADIALDTQTDRTFALPDNIPPVWNWLDRTKEIHVLKTLITDPAPPLSKGGLGGVPIAAIALVGLPGIGKTTLISQLIRQLQTENNPFVAVAWQSLEFVKNQAPQFDWFLDSLLSALSSVDTPNFSEQNAPSAAPVHSFQKIEKLLKLLKSKPCLIVCDRVETIMQFGRAETAGYFSETQSEYAWLFKLLIETAHQSKIIFISRETLAELPPTITREMTLDGLTNNCAVALLTSFNLIATIEEMTELAHRYQGHPEALQLVASLIRDDSEYQGNVSKFLQDRDWLLIRPIESLLDEMIARLSDMERTCLSRISVYQTAEYPLDFAGIAAQMPEVSKYELKENIILALKRRQLLYYDFQRSSYQLHPLVREKGDRLLNQNPENFRTAHRQAYHYFISIPLKPESEWQDIEDIKPLIRAHYHACQAGDLDAAAIAISGVDEYLKVWNCQEQICSYSPLPLLADVQEFTEDLPQDSPYSP